jgi:hypothetical protein
VFQAIANEYSATVLVTWLIESAGHNPQYERLILRPLQNIGPSAERSLERILSVGTVAVRLEAIAALGRFAQEHGTVWNSVLAMLIHVLCDSSEKEAPEARKQIVEIGR